MDGWKDGWMDGRMDARMDGWIDGWIDGWKDGWMDGWMGTPSVSQPETLELIVGRQDGEAMKTCPPFSGVWSSHRRQWGGKGYFYAGD